MRETPWVIESPSPKTSSGSSIPANVEATQIPDSADSTISELPSPVGHLRTLPDVPQEPTKPAKLEVFFGGQMVVPSWSDELRHTVDKFIHDHPREKNHDLIVKWSPCSPRVDPGGQEDAATFTKLFHRLAEFVTLGDNPICRAISGFQRVDITVPEDAGVDPTRVPRRMPGEHRPGAINFRTTPNIREFCFSGSFLTLAEKFTLTSLAELTVLTNLKLTHCRISVNDAVALLQFCFQLETLKLETIYDEENCEAGSRLMLDPGDQRKLPLSRLWITARTNVSPILRRIDLQQSIAVTLTAGNGTCTADDNLLQSIREIDTSGPNPFEVRGGFRQDTIDHILSRGLSFVNT